ncbi:MAG: hypothetical protein IJX92_07915 [Clostridia bacterium]|nr:hypothetical protein [Clostridia bacterium]
MKKIIGLFLLLTLLCALMVSCGPKDSQDGEASASDDCVWSSTVAPVIIVSDQDIFNYFSKVQSHVYQTTGKYPEIRSSYSDSITHEISLGETGSPLAKMAYRYLDDVFNLSMLDAKGQSAWLIYADGGSIAVAYSDTLAKKEAVNYITSNLTAPTYSPAKGVVSSGVFNTEEYIINLREESQASAFSDIEKALGADARDALARLYKLYDEDLYIWFANLYCPDVGGFYYSASARDNEGYLPDLESTAQGLNMLERSGLASAYSDEWARMLPYEIGENILAFAKSLQEEDGYFYHPQWGTGISDSRRGRDAGWARQIISAMGSRPNYPYISDQNVDVSGLTPITEHVGQSAVTAVSRVVATATNEDKYASEKNFISYLDGLFEKGNSYSAGNAINSTVSAIKKNNLWETLKTYLRDKQNKSNGLWENEVTYQSVNGLMKLCTVFGGSFPNAERAMDSAIKILMRPIDDGLDAITTVYNPWVAIANLLNAVSETKEQELRNMLYSNAKSIFVMTAEKLSAFAKNDGGFSYYRDYSAPYSQDALVAVSGSAESDVNSTSIAISTVVRYMEEVYNLTFPQVFCEYDSIYFLDTLDKMYSIVKNRMEDPEVETFDDFVESDGEIVAGVVTKPGRYVTNKIGDSGDFVWFESSVVQNPKSTDENEKDLVLYVADMINENAAEDEKKVASTASSTEFKISNFATPGTCYVFESDMLFVGMDDISNPAAQLTFVREGSALISAWVDFYQYKRFGQNYIRIQEYFAGADGIKDTEIAAGIPVDDWFHLRVEMYKDYSGEGGAVVTRLKFYVNDTLVGISDSGHYEKGEYKDFLISAIRLSYYRHSASALYLNNVYVAKTSQTFEYKGIEDSDTTVTVGEKHVWDFEDGIPNSHQNFTDMFYKDNTLGMTYINAADWTTELDNTYGGSKSPGAKIYSVSDPENAANNVIRAYSYNTKSSSYKATMYIDGVHTSESAETWEVEFDYFFDKITWLYSSDFLSVDLQNKNGSRIAGITFTGLGWDETHKTELLGIKLSNGKALENFALNDATWYTFKMVYHYDELSPADSRLLLYVKTADGYACIANEQLTGKAGIIDRAGFSFLCYDIRGAQYIDDVSVTVTDRGYVNDTPIDGEIKLPEAPDDKTYIDGSSRGEGVYFENAEKFKSVTFNSLVSDGVMSENTMRGSGVSSGKRTLSFLDVDKDGALIYTALDSGNHALNFVSKKTDTAGFVFEADVKLDGVDAEPGRDIRFTASNSLNGDHKNNNTLWGFNIKIHKNPKESVGGYILTIAGSDQEFVIKENTWVNIRLVAFGLDAGDALYLFINNECVVKTSLTSGIKGVKCVELYTPSTSGAQGFVNGSVYVDNIYVSCASEGELQIPEEDGGSGDSDSDRTNGTVTGGNMDGSSWDEN